MKKKYKFLYNILAETLPLSNSRHKFASRRLRYLSVKKNVDSMDSNVNVEGGRAFPYSVKNGNNSGLGVYCELNGEVEIGKNVLMGPNVIIYTQNHAFQERNVLIIKKKYYTPKKVVLGDGIWNGHRAITLPSVHISRGSVIGACDVVAKYISEYAIAVWNPSRN